MELESGTTTESNMTTETTMADSTKTYSPSERNTLEKLGGFSNESISDIEVLYEFNIKGQIIPSWFKDTIKWHLSESLDKSDFVNALEHLSKIGILNK